MAAATVDAHVTVKQHGFHVKQPLTAALLGGAPVAGGLGSTPDLLSDLGQLPSPAGLPSPYQRREEGARGLLYFATPCGAVPSSSPGGSVQLPLGSGCLEPAEHAHLTPGVKRMMKSVVRGLKALQEPEAASEGLGGTYFFANEAGQKIAIMKPCDEEPLAPNNPKGFVGRRLGEPGLKPTVRVGEAAAREVAAYLLDHDRFARVPHTVMVRMTHPCFHTREGEAGPPCKRGSLQQFVPHDCDTSEMGASRFSVRDVQRIGILDIRLFNTDRHAGNMLVRRPRTTASLARMDGAALLEAQQYELVPIDHGFALPEALEPPYFEWQHWPQAMLPFGREELEYIAALDAKADVEMLRQEVPSLRVESLRVLEVCTTVLKECAAAGLTLAEIAGVLTRPLIGVEEEPSELERVCFNARAEVEDISDSDIEEAAEEGLASDESDGDFDVVAMLSVEEEAPLTSPTFSCGSEHTTFKMMSLGGSGSEASRIEDALFSMDEDGSRTPRSRSPDLGHRLPPSRFAAEAGKALPASAASGHALPPVTPKAAGLAVNFLSPALTAGGEDSLPESFDSLTLHCASQALDESGSMAGTLSGFRGAASFAPMRSTARRTGSSGGAGASGNDARRAVRKARSRRKFAVGSRLLKMTAQNYPPLVEARGGGGAGASLSALAVFRGLSEEQWEQFMASVRAQVACKLLAGAWRQASAPKGGALQSCPRF